MKSIAFSIIFHSTTWNSMLKLLKEHKKYSVNTYAQVEISLNTCRNTLDFMCDLELFSKIQSHIMYIHTCICTIGYARMYVGTFIVYSIYVVTYVIYLYVCL